MLSHRHWNHKIEWLQYLYIRHIWRHCSDVAGLLCSSRLYLSDRLFMITPMNTYLRSTSKVLCQGIPMIIDVFPLHDNNGEYFSLLWHRHGVFRSFGCDFIYLSKNFVFSSVETYPSDLFPHGLVMAWERFWHYWSLWGGGLGESINHWWFPSQME